MRPSHFPHTRSSISLVMTAGHFELHLLVNLGGNCISPMTHVFLFMRQLWKLAKVLVLSMVATEPWIH